MSIANRPPVRPANLWILQSAFLIGLIAYVGLGIVMFGNRPRGDGAAGGPGGLTAPAPPDTGFGSTFGLVLLGAGLLLIAVAFLLPRFIAGLDPDRATTADAYLDNAFKQLVITNALLETPALLAFVSIILGQPMSTALIVIGLSAAGMLLMFPKIRGWIDEYERRAVREGQAVGQ